MLNKSKSKQKYSFSKGDRFPQPKQFTQKHTELNDSRISDTYSLSKCPSQTAGGFGATKRELFKNSIVSPAAKYSIKSGFEINLMQKKGTSLSYSRNSIDNSNFSYIKKSVNPGPGQYNCQKIKSKKKIVIGTKTRNPCQEAFLNEKAINNNPAPNKYDLKKKLPKTGKIVTLSMRFTEGNDLIPGPGSYEVDKYKERSQSKDLSSSQNTFCKAERKHKFDKQNKVPGPGSYKTYSQFD